jgi:hypothetical protein
MFNKTDGACTTHGVKVHIGFWWENLRERNNLEDLGVEGKMDNQQVGWGHGLVSPGSG